MKHKLLNVREHFMSEKILIGGEVLTRQQAMINLQSEGVAAGAIDWCVFSVPALSEDELYWLACRDLVLVLRCRIVQVDTWLIDW